jgi:hypothetical protein
VNSNEAADDECTSSKFTVYHFWIRRMLNFLFLRLAGGRCVRHSWWSACKFVNFGQSSCPCAYQRIKRCEAINIFYKGL